MNQSQSSALADVTALPPFGDIDIPSADGCPGSAADAIRNQETAPLRLCRSVCIDDDPDFLSILRRHLMQLGIGFTGATNAVLGMRAIHRERPDLVIADYHMPNAHGTFLLRCLRQDLDLSTTPIIIVTGVDLRSSLDERRPLTVEQQLRRLGARSILRKPLNAHALSAAVHKCLEWRMTCHTEAGHDHRAKRADRGDPRNRGES